jgi:hypothetical protein
MTRRIGAIASLLSVLLAASLKAQEPPPEFHDGPPPLAAEPVPGPPPPPPDVPVPVPPKNPLISPLNQVYVYPKPLGFVPETEIDPKTQRYVFVDPARPQLFKRLLNKIGHCCYATINTPGCGNLKSDLTFIFGSCRQFWSDPCTPGPEPLPLPVGVEPIPTKHGAPQGGCRSCNW